MKLPKVYEPGQYEADIYTLWETSGSFMPKGEGKPYSIVMPPPNANGNLHLGHALMIAVEDVLIRYHRMIGDSTLWIPGADHAGFETWVVYERYLEEQGKSRFDFNRDELYRQVWDFVAQNRGNMEIQLRELGASTDWSKLVFTLDDSVVDVAYQTFKQMWDDGLVYRGERLVNFCTKHQTSFADIEVEHKDEKTHIWEIRYPLVEGEGEIVVATTRPETMFGDVAVAVHPNDKRYKKLVGKHVVLPLIDKTIPVIADEMVDMEFGTGAVKITPAHDQNDFETGERHALPRVSVINFDGTMNDETPFKYQGMPWDTARKLVVDDLKDQGYLVGKKSYSHSVGHCYKCGTIIQPLLKDQWFIRVKPLADKAIAAINSKKIRFIPESKGKVVINYLKNLKDWNISRQIPWGIPIPAFQSEDDADKWIFDERVGEEQITADGTTYTRDPDTFDTWFSSGQWPYIVTKYHDSGELGEFFPTSVMETGYDILFQWVARMIMFSLYRENKVPFKDVYLHGLVLDPKGQKMSKSKGNVINPQDIMQEYGSDALRLGLLASRTAGQNQAFGKAKVVAGRNFCNKLWNIARYVEGVVGESSTLGTPTPKSPADYWIISELSRAAKEIADHIEKYRFAEAFETVYHTVWDKMADWYLEASKSGPEPSVMVWALEMCLRLAHPFAPFVTETIWQTLKWEHSQLINAAWPEPLAISKTEVKQFEVLRELILETREVLSEVGSKDIGMTTAGSKFILDNAELIQRMSRVGYVQDEPAKAETGLKLGSTKEDVWLDLDNAQLSTYRKNLQDKLEASESQVKVLERRLKSKSYVEKAPQHLVDESHEQLTQLKDQVSHIKELLKQI
jgi:valyl-tRNA synthetase